MRRMLTVCAVAAMVLAISGVANAALVNKGNGLIYDTDLNITWYDSTYVSSNWADAVSWATNLTAGGVTGWRLPSTVDGVNNWGYDGTTTSGYNITTSEMGHLFYTELGNNGAYDIYGNERPDFLCVDVYNTIWADYDIAAQNSTGLFTNLQLGGAFYPALYWSGTQYSPYTDNAWTFDFTYGEQVPYSKATENYYALAVHEGDVPEPATMCLFGLGASLISRRKRS